MFLSVSKAAEYIGVSISTLRRWDKEGYLKPDFRSNGGHRRYDLSALRDRFMLPSLARTEIHALGYVSVIFNGI